ncbi:geranylgeranyl transferase type-2 subunit alpha-like isoform X2 [Halichondria panicea]|uniref:geranylgeranyl transferase type-2 subunit alpha-like isoform X2 n=1 Tax=Halichondria panicea TaxID=6063 RepID=UPI00312B88D4
MHGRVKVRSSEEQDRARKKERDDKASAYKTVMAQIFNKRESGCLDDECLSLTREVLCVNPEIATLWNYRREIFVERQANMSDEEFSLLCCKELNLLESCLRVNPKAYCVWLSRQWILLHCPQADWVREKGLCDKLLNYDERNFHCWDHRRFVIQQSHCVSVNQELSFTYDKIASNFSNYSAWHYRSQLLPLVHPSSGSPSDDGGLVSGDALAKEHELAQNAFFTDPDDQSAWFYHRWLLGEVRCLDSVDMVYLQVSSQPKLVISFNQPLNVHQRLCITMDGEIVCEIVCEGEWPTTLYQTTLPTLPSTINISFDQQNISLSPRCLLTTVLLMQSLDPVKYSPLIQHMTSRLCQVDPLRKSYYTDLMSRFMLRQALRVSTHLTALDLSGMGLTRLEHTQYLLPYERLDLSGNALRCLPPTLICPALTRLILDDNHLVALPHIQAPLQHLSLTNNYIAELEAIKEALKSLLTLQVLCLQGNPLCSQGKPLLQDMLRAIVPGLVELTL